MRGMGSAAGRGRQKAVTACILLPVALVALGAAPTAAQEVDRPTHVWLGVGLVSAAGPEVSDLIGFAAEAIVQRPPHHFGLRGLAVANVTSGPDDAIGEVDLLYGRTATTSYAHAMAAVGASVVQFDGCPGDSSVESCTTVGVPFVLEAGLSAAVVGLGVQGYVNLNPTAVYGGITVLLRFGALP